MYLFSTTELKFIWQPLYPDGAQVLTFSENIHSNTQNHLLLRFFPLITATKNGFLVFLYDLLTCAHMLLLYVYIYILFIYLIATQTCVFIILIVDEDSNGAIDYEELKKSFHKLEISCTEEEINDLFQACDINEDKGIDFNEFIVLLCLVYLLKDDAATLHAVS